MPSKKRPRVIYNPVDIMSKEERKKYTKGGVVLEYHIYKDIEKVPSLEEIRAMDKEKAEEVLSKALSYHTQRELADHWGKSQSMFRTLHKNYNLPKQSKGRRPSKDAKVEVDNSAKMSEWVKRGELEKAKQAVENQEEEIQKLKAKIKKLSSRPPEKDTNLLGYTMKNEGQYFSLVRTAKGGELGNEIANMATVLEEKRAYKMILEVREIKKEEEQHEKGD